MRILEHSYWLKFWSNQSECLKMSVVYRIGHRLEPEMSYKYAAKYAAAAAADTAGVGANAGESRKFRKIFCLLGHLKLYFYYPTSHRRPGG